MIEESKFNYSEQFDKLKETHGDEIQKIKTAISMWIRSVIPYMEKNNFDYIQGQAMTTIIAQFLANNSVELYLAVVRGDNSTDAEKKADFLDKLSKIYDMNVKIIQQREEK